MKARKAEQASTKPKLPPTDRLDAQQMTGNSDTEMHISNNSQLYSHHSTAVLAGSLLSSRSRVIFLDVDGVLLAAGSVEMCSPLPEALN